MEIKNLLREKSLAESVAEYIQIILELNHKLAEVTAEKDQLKATAAATDAVKE